MILQGLQLVWKLPLIEILAINIVSFQNKTFFKKLHNLYFQCHVKYNSDCKETGLFPFSFWCSLIISWQHNLYNHLDNLDISKLDF